MKANEIFGYGNSEFIHTVTLTDNFKLPNSEYEYWCPDCQGHDHEELLSKVYRSMFSSFDKFSYKTNNYGFRSDNFDVEKSSLNFLYAGCSNTFGSGMPIEKTWAYKLNNFLEMKDFYSVALPGASADVVIQNIITYIKKIGKPKGIFVLFPNISRVTILQEKTFSDVGKQDVLLVEYNSKMFPYYPKPNYINNEKDFSENYLMLRFYQNISALELICKELSIPLVWSTWDEDFSKKIKKELIQFVSNYVDLYDKKNLFDIDEYSKVEKTNFKNRSRDGHPPESTQLYWSLFFKNAWSGK
jgi:hypothetical protein